MAYLAQSLLSCLKLSRGQTAFLPTRQNFAQHYARAWIKKTLFAQPGEDSEVERYVHQAYRASGLEPPSIRWFDSPVPFILACRDQLTGASEEYDMLVDDGRALDTLWTYTIESIRACFPEEMIENMCKPFRQKNACDLARRLQNAIRVSIGIYKDQDTALKRQDGEVWDDELSVNDAWEVCVEECIKDSTAAYTPTQICTPGSLL